MQFHVLRHSRERDLQEQRRAFVSRVDTVTGGERCFSSRVSCTSVVTCSATAFSMICDSRAVLLLVVYKTPQADTSAIFSSCASSTSALTSFATALCPLRFFSSLVSETSMLTTSATAFSVICGSSAVCALFLMKSVMTGCAGWHRHRLDRNLRDGAARMSAKSH